MKILLHINRFFLLLVMAVASFTANGQVIQRYNTFRYTVNEGLLQSTMCDINFDNNNLCWLSFPNGIQKFDGNKFTDVPVQPGLPDNKWVKFFRCRNGDLIISHARGLSRYDISSNKFVQFFHTDSAVTKPMIFIGEDEEIFYCYTEYGTITGFSCGNNVKVREFANSIPGYRTNQENVPTISQNIVNHHVAIKVGSDVYLVNLKEQKLAYKPVHINGIFHYFLWMENDHQVMYYKHNASTELVTERYNFNSGVVQSFTNILKPNFTSFRSKIYNWSGKTIVSFFNHIYEMNTGFDSVKHELVDYQNKPISGNASIVKMIEDNYGNLYLQTINDGFRKIIRNSYPIKYYGAEKKEESYTISVLADKENNRIIAGTYGSGILIFDTLQRLIKHVTRLPGDMGNSSVNCILKKPNGDYIISALGDKMWLLYKDLSSFKILPVKSASKDKKAEIGYFANILFQNDSYAVIKSQTNFYRINLATNVIQEYKYALQGDVGGILFNRKIVTFWNDVFILLDPESFSDPDFIRFANTGGVRCFLKASDNKLYVGTNTGIYVLDSNYRTMQQINKRSGLPDECIYAMALDRNGNIWCSTNKGLVRINENKNIFQLTKEDGLQENEFNTNIVDISKDGELFFGGVNGTSSFYPASINAYEEKINVFFTGIKINNENKFSDTAVWAMDEIDLPYDQNSLAFDFIAMANNNPDHYIYQYKMQGVDDEWSQNNDLQTVHYFLAPGKYVFRIYASRVFNKDALAMKEIHIRIHPPFWKTWWFLVIITLLSIAILAYSINGYIKRKYQQKLSELESERKIQLERERISRDLHDNIGAYANTVLYKTDLLQKDTQPHERNDLMNDLRFASKDIITSLRETIWALKKEQYSAQECLLRIRNFIQPFTRYYPNIKFTVTGEAPVAVILHYTKALNLVRMVQEAVTNAMKHAGAFRIHIDSSIENTKWKLVVSDNGSGFDIDGAHKLQEGNGLTNMKERAADAGFDFTLDSKPGLGTTIIIFV